jgi:hypothetical protein
MKIFADVLMSPVMALMYAAVHDPVADVTPVVHCVAGFRAEGSVEIHVTSLTARHRIIRVSMVCRVVAF